MDRVGKVKKTHFKAHILFMTSESDLKKNDTLQ